MNNTKNIINQKINTIKATQLLFYSFPVSFIIGNLIVTLNLLIFIAISLFLIKKEKLNFRFSSSNWFLIAFFSYLFISTLIQFQVDGPLQNRAQHWSFEENPIFKSLMLFRFVILLFLIDTLFFNKILNLKKFFLSSLICTSFVSLDIIFQYIVGFDIFGYKSLGDRNSGPFNDEWIAGSYLYKFSFFSFFYIYQLNKINNKNKLFLILVIAIHTSAIFLAGNRMPLLLYFLTIFIIVLFVKDLRTIAVAGVLAFLSIFIALEKLEIGKDYEYKLTDTYTYLYKEVNFLGKKLINKKSKTKIDEDTQDPFDSIKKDSANKLLFRTGHRAIYLTSIDLWKEKPWIGYGLKSFRIMCYQVIAKDYGRVFKPEVEMEFKNVDRMCSNHSHNYYLELLVETGLIGAALMIFYFLILLKKIYSFLRKNFIANDSSNYLLIPIMIIFFVEIWPLRSTGSFFTTGNATFFWLIVGMLMNMQSKKNNILS
tara:strand:+ start:1418 stop:2863 length:1446 start_codon:yes stop_codon:yes gene_type:complete